NGALNDLRSISRGQPRLVTSPAAEGAQMQGLHHFLLVMRPGTLDASGSASERYVGLYRPSEKDGNLEFLPIELSSSGPVGGMLVGRFLLMQSQPRPEPFLGWANLFSTPAAVGPDGDDPTGDVIERILVVSD